MEPPEFLFTDTIPIPGSEIVRDRRASGASVELQNTEPIPGERVASVTEQITHQPIMSPSALQTKKSYSIAAMPGDGIGPEVVEAGIDVLKALAETQQGFELEFKNYDWSSELYKKTGKYIPDGGLEELKKHDAILFGAVGAPGKHERARNRYHG